MLLLNLWLLQATWGTSLFSCLHTTPIKAHCLVVCAVYNNHLTLLEGNAQNVIGFCESHKCFLFCLFFLIHKHYAWHPKDLTVKLSLETQIWINVSSVSWKITAFEINTRNVHNNVFPVVKKKKIKSVNHNHYQSSVCWGSPKGHQIPVWNPLGKPSFTVCGGGGLNTLFRPITERAGSVASYDWIAEPRSRGKTGRDSSCPTRLSTKPKERQSDTATAKGVIVSGKRTWTKRSPQQQRF